ncbi:hypothetical protein DXG01_008571 [Tephrocybe rancida]|nr:hypothetical protein DXG01_008571 [Tephrocybe rancida]
MSQLVSVPYPPIPELRPSTAIPGLSPNTYTVLAVADARIYHAQLATKTPEWCYSRMRGTLVFGKDCEPGERPGHMPPNASEANSHWFRLLDSTSGRPIWIFKVPGVTKNRTLSFSLRSKSPSNNERPSIRPSISPPTVNSFVHVAHVGLNGEGIIEATSGIDPSWIAILDGHGQRDFDEGAKMPGTKLSFGEGFWRGGLEASHSRGGSTTELVGYRNGKPVVPLVRIGA